MAEDKAWLSNEEVLCCLSVSLSTSDEHPSDGDGEQHAPVDLAATPTKPPKRPSRRIQGTYSL